MYLQGVALTKVPKIKFLIIIGGAKFKATSVAEKAYGSPIQCPSLHFLGIYFSRCTGHTNSVKKINGLFT